MTDGRFRHLRAVLRNAMTWGAAWAVIGGALVTVVNLLNPEPGIDSLAERVGIALFGGVMLGVRFGLAGAVIGTVFAGVIRLGYRGRRLADINPLKFAAVGALVGGVGVPLYLQTMNVLSGDGPIAWGLVGDDAIWSTLFGAAAAAGSILLARRADALSSGSRPDRLERADDLDALPAAGLRETSLTQRSRSVKR
jgi:hypothetical protein